MQARNERVCKLKTRGFILPIIIFFPSHSFFFFFFCSYCKEAAAKWIGSTQEKKKKTFCQLLLDKRIVANAGKLLFEKKTVKLL